MTSFSHSHHHHHDPHDWASAEYVAKWAKGQDPKEAGRRQAFSLLADNPVRKAAADHDSGPRRRLRRADEISSRTISTSDGDLTGRVGGNDQARP